MWNTKNAFQTDEVLLNKAKRCFPLFIMPKSSPLKKLELSIGSVHIVCSIFPTIIQNIIPRIRQNPGLPIFMIKLKNLKTQISNKQKLK